MKGIVAVGIIYFAFLYFCHAQTIPPEVLDKASGFGINLTAINQTAALSKLNEIKNLLKNKCEKNGGPDAFDKAFAAKDDLLNCLQGLVNFTVLNREMEEAKPTGDLDIVFKKYCDKQPILEQCVSNFTNALDPCLEPVEKDNEAIFKDAMHSVLEFVCHKEGDRIALFIGSGGKECFQNKYVDVGKCINSTYGGYVQLNKSNPEIPTLTSLPMFMFNHKTCNDAVKTQACIVEKLVTCEDPTPGNLMDALMTFVRRQTPCEHILEKAVNDALTSTEYSSSNKVGIHSLVFLLPAIIIRLI